MRGRARNRFSWHFCRLRRPCGGDDHQRPGLCASEVLLPAGAALAAVPGQTRWVAGTWTTSPSSLAAHLIWHDRRLNFVGSSEVASSMSSSSALAPGSASNHSGATKTWHVAQDKSPPHSPTTPSTQLLTAACITDSAGAATTSRRSPSGLMKTIRGTITPWRVIADGPEWSPASTDSKSLPGASTRRGEPASLRGIRGPAATPLEDTDG